MPTVSKISLCIGFTASVIICCLVIYKQQIKSNNWTDAEIAILRNLRLPQFYSVEDPSNKLLNNPKAELLGKILFFDTQLSRSQQIACVTCHQPEHFFSLPADSSITLDKQVPTLLGVASFSWFMMDGSADSLWAQALIPLEDHIEHGGTRTQYVQHVLNDYPELYQEVFGGFPYLLTTTALPAQASPKSQYTEEQHLWQQLDPMIQKAINHVYSNIGKLLAAYQATLWPKDSRFDRFVDHLTLQGETKDKTAKSTGTNNNDNAHQQSLLTPDEIAGLKLFISEQGQCLRCHNGVLFSNGDFHATTVPHPHPNAQKGRFEGIKQALSDPFNCLGDYSDNAPTQCKELIYSKKSSNELKSATKVPSLRNIGQTAPYMHSGQFATLNEVLHYYNRAATPFGTHTDLEPLKLLPYQLNQLEAFLLTLTEDSSNAPEHHQKQDHQEDHNDQSISP